MSRGPRGDTPALRCVALRLTASRNLRQRPAPPPVPPFAPARMADGARAHERDQIMTDAADPMMQVAHALADAGRIPALRHFRAKGLSADNKAAAGAFDPVTVADREVEAAMRATLARLRPDDAIIGEEQAATGGATGLTWVLDPIDGTRAFLIGAPTWGMLIGLSDATGGAPRARLGVMDQPWTGDRFWGDGKAAFTARPGHSDGAETPRRLTTRRVTDLADALLSTTFPEVGTPEEAALFAGLKSEARLTRYGLDCTAYALLAAGHLDLVAEAGLQPYDILALIPIIEGAGGVVTGWDGGVALNGGRVLAAANAELHAAALARLAG
ncbi:MAG: histidinol phosphatase-like enzyme (inositol monophosphatase family) [Paracoccaceae bacterium]|jgi:histidinol phosphatase-like enzyme (inositol monophosphatase family)